MQEGAVTRSPLPVGTAVVRQVIPRMDPVQETQAAPGAVLVVPATAGVVAAVRVPLGWLHQQAKQAETGVVGRPTGSTARQPSVAAVGAVNRAHPHGRRNPPSVWDRRAVVTAVTQRGGRVAAAPEQQAQSTRVVAEEVPGTVSLLPPFPVGAGL